MKFSLRVLCYALFGLLVGQLLLGYGLSQEPTMGETSGAYNYGLFQLETLVSTSCLFLVIGILREGVRYIKEVSHSKQETVL